MIYIDYRKLIGFSNGSFVVTMPKSWVGKHNLKKGDMIGIDENTDQLVFYAGAKEAEKEEKPISINADDKSLALIKAEIVTAYLNNYSTIEIFSSTLHDDAPAIKGIIRNLSGMEIIEQTGSRIVAKDLIDVSSISIQSIIRRMDTITRSMIDDTISCIHGKCNPNGILHRDTDVNRLYYLGARVIKNAIDDPMAMNRLKTSPWRLLSDKSMLRRIEEIADNQKRVCRLVANAEFEGEILEEFRQINEEVKARYNDVMKAYYTNDKKLAFDIEMTHKGCIERCNKFFEKASKNLSVEISHGKEPTTLSRTNIVPLANIIEYKKATLNFIRHLSRIALSMDQ